MKPLFCGLARPIAACSFLFLTSVGSSVAAPPNGGPPAVAPTQAASNPIAPAAGTFDADSYFRIKLSVVVKEEALTGIIPFTDCPTDIAGFKFENILGDSHHAAIVIDIVEPGLPQIELAPVIADKSAWFFGRTCSTSVYRTPDDAPYLSPMFSVASYNSAATTVAVNFDRSDAAYSQDALKATQDLITAALPLSHIPASVLAITGALSTIPSKVLPATTSKQLNGSNLMVTTTFAAAGETFTPSSPLKFELSVPTGDTSKTIEVTASLVEVPTIFTLPMGGASWSKDVILGSAFALPVKCAGGSPVATISDYVYCSVGPQLANYTGAAIGGANSAADKACYAIDLQLNALKLSPRDRARLMWAIVQMHGSYVGNEATFDKMTCLSPYWAALKKDSVEPHQAAGSADPSAADISLAATQGEPLANFFKITGWDLRRTYGVKLFTFPVSYSDATGSVLAKANDTIPNIDYWQGLMNNHPDVPIFGAFGCYAFLSSAQVAASGDLTADVGPGSKLFAIAQLPNASGDEHEVFIDFDYAKMAPGDAAKINGIKISGSLTAAERAFMRSIYPGTTCGASGWSPKILFGP